MEPIYTQSASEAGRLWTTPSFVGPWAFRKLPSWWTCYWQKEPRYRRELFCAASLWVVGYDLSRHFGQVACGRSLQKRWIDRYQWRYGHIPHCYVDGARPSGNLPAVVILLLLHSTLNFGYGWCCYCCFYPPLELLLQSLIVMITILILKKIGITIVMVMKEYRNNRMDSEYVCENDFIGERRIYMLGRRGEDQYLNTSID